MVVLGKVASLRGGGEGLLFWRMIMFVKANQHRRDDDMGEWYLLPCFVNTNLVEMVVIKPHPTLGLVASVNFSDGVSYLELRYPELPFPSCVRVD
jgi:hypothetical protein